jgi:hypothetical protein
MKLNNSIQVLIAGCILLPGFTILGCILGWMVYRYDLEPYKAWKNLGVPPAEIKDLLVADKDTIYIQSTDGRIFSCYRATQYDQDCWNQVDTISPVWEDEPSCPPIDDIPPEPAGVIDRLVNRRCIDSPVLRANEISVYLLLTDGTVMQWISDPVGPNEVDLFYKKAFVGCLIGVFGSVVVSFLLFKSDLIFSP